VATLSDPVSILAPDKDLTGKSLGDFQVIRRLGEGGMGQVYLAEQTSLKRKVALKIMRAEVALNPTSLQRFKAEAEAVARITHANIVQVYAIDEFQGLHYMALEYVDGHSLREYLAKKGPPELPLALSIMRQVASALTRAGEVGIVHRDIKPDNILLSRRGEVKVADFGLVRSITGDQPAVHLTQSGVTVGTPLYMSPEQVQGKPLDPRSDIYSFGVTCYHMLAGRPPFTGETAFEVALQHVQGDAEPLHEVRPDLPAELCDLVHDMMARNPDDRPQTGRDLLKELTKVREAISGQPTGQLVPITVTSAGAESDDEFEGTEEVEHLPVRSSRTLVSKKSKKSKQAAALWPWVVLSLVVAAGAGAVLAAIAARRNSPQRAEQAPPPPPPSQDRAPPAPRIVTAQLPQAFDPPPAPANDRPPFPPPDRPPMPPDRPPPPPDRPQNQPPPPPLAQERERFLRDQINAATNEKDRVWAFREAMLFFFDQNDLQGAERFFREYRGTNMRTTPQYALATLGDAIIAGARGDVDGSYKLFSENLKQLEFRLGLKHMVAHDPQLRVYIVRALEIDMKKKPLPPELQVYLKPPQDWAFQPGRPPGRPEKMMKPKGN
jgi:serine/threonine protein kinase